MKSTIRLWLAAAAVLLLVLSAVVPLSAAQKAFLMKGKITAIDLDYQTVVIEVPLKGKSFTVAGPLSPDAVLTRNGRSATLSDYQVGEPVTVVWHGTSKGHVIDKLEAR